MFTDTLVKSFNIDSDTLLYMSTRIGGPHKCNIHPEFETDDTNEFNEHCANAEGHETVGHVPCTSCGCDIDLGTVPFQPIGQETRLQCANCFNKTQDLNRMVLDQQSQIQEQQPEEQVLPKEIQEAQQKTGGKVL